MVSLKVSSSSKPPPFARDLPLDLNLSPEATIGDVKKAIAARFPKFKTSRQKLSLTTDRKALDDEAKLSEVLNGELEGGELQVKDLGPQISWRTVFLVEYVGPIIIHPLVYYFPRLWYGKEVQHSSLQKYVFAFVMLHFIKREFETVFVHRFSHGTMPLGNIVKNSGHYHIFSGVLLALDVYRQKYSATSPFILGTYHDNETFLWVCAGIWALAEVSNLHTHITLRNLRPAGTRNRAIPYGYGFTHLSCPNYFFETIAWGVICAMTQSIASYIFFVLAVGQMTVWALKKHRTYKKEFGKEYPRGRKAIFPFIL